ncbi:MAG TPA: uracil-DNA glycosylase family protein [Bacteroidales bacterium]|nr:uracil-DNA glycosylase family protein [Bacteroidales bacterium]
MNKDTEILNYQKKCWKQYKSAIGLDEKYTYLYGNPVKVHVPLDTAVGGIMIIGAYPTAHFNTINGVADVPVSDHLYPFSNESYFDGSRIRPVESGRELKDEYLDKLGISRNHCWITDLVKVFLFKEGHIKKYETLGYKGHSATRKRFSDFAKKSRPLLLEEIQLADPKIILTLGSEVAAAVFQVSEKAATSMMNETPVPLQISESVYQCWALPHPGIIMKNTAQSVVWKAMLTRQIKTIKTYLQ